MKTWMAGLAAAGMLVSGAAQAALVDRGGGLIYDTTLNITWLKDANYAKTSGYDADGLMARSQATAWVANLSYYDSVRGVTYTDWRLPTITDTGTSGCNFSVNGTDCGYNVNPATGEMAHLWYIDFGNKAYYTPSGGAPQAGWGLVDDPLNSNDESLFVNIQSDVYWSGTAYAPDPVNEVWHFDVSNGDQRYSWPFLFFAWAVRPGDVAADSSVPEPATLALTLAGVALAGVARRRRSVIAA